VNSVPPGDDQDEYHGAIPDAPPTVEGEQPFRIVAEKGRSLAGWLSDGFDRLTWRTPLPDIRSNGSVPDRLVANPDDPIIGDAVRGRSILAGRLTFRGETQVIADLDFGRPLWGAAFGEYLHGFAWLRDLSTVAPLAQAAPIAMRLTATWLATHGEQLTDAVWAPELWGRRLLFWVLHAALVMPGTDPDHDARVRDTLARGARHLDRCADKATPGVARIAAWCGVVAAGLLIPGTDPRRGFGEAGLGRALAGGLFEDGGAVSRSPAVLLDTVMLLAMLREVYTACEVDVPEAVVAALMRAVPALLGSLHGDLALSSWQGGGPGDADQIAAVIAASGVRTRPLRQSRDWGYQRLAAGPAVLIVDAAPPPIARLVAGGCASTLAFEFSDGPVRLIVNCGGAQAGNAALPPSLLEGLRTTAAHSTLTLGDTNSTAIHPDGTLGRGVGQVELSRQEADNASRIEASHDGYVRRWGLLHRRQLMLTGDGRELRGEDALMPSGRRRGGSAPFAIRFHLGAGVAAEAAADGQGAVLHTRDGTDRGATWQFRCRGGALGIEDSVWIDGAGRPVATRQLVIVGEAASGGAQIGWMLKRTV
jgi:uncharacterized heparinase superfamily protein